MKNTEQLKKYRGMKDSELAAALLDLKKKLAENSLKVQAGKLDNYSLITKTKREIARIKTLISEKNLES